MLYDPHPQQRISDLRELHYGVDAPDQVSGMVTVCYEDGHLWPCDIGVLLEAAAELTAALAPFARHSLGGYDGYSNRVVRIRVTEGQIMRAWSALEQLGAMPRLDAEQGQP
jgi:glycogen debranching enzyme